jgi:hypothetical protein
MVPFGSESSHGHARASLQNAVSLQAHEMEHIRNVFDEDTKEKRYSCVVSPRVDAQMFRNTERHAVPCECIVELYELLWRWGHSNTSRPDFAQNFGFAIPDTIVVVKGRPYAWYFISRKDGALLRKCGDNLNVAAVEKKLCRDRKEGEMPICATWMPMASQFQEARCHSPYVEFLTVNNCRNFLSSMKSSHSGIIQAFVEPHGVSNFLVRTVQYMEQTSLCVRTNRSILSSTTKGGNPFDRCASFEGWPGLSSTSSRYRSHKHPQMEERILAAGDALNGRIEQERVRQMLFLDPTQHVALHFKVTTDHQLYFIYASVVPQKEVILQTRPQLLMGDPCMNEELELVKLLPGGTDMKAIPYRGPVPGSTSARDMSFGRVDEDQMTDADRDYMQLLQRGEFAQEDIASPQGRGNVTNGEATYLNRRTKVERRPAQEDAPSVAQFFPRMNYERPKVPDPPYKIQDPPLEVDHLGRPTCASLDSLKKPLIFPLSARSIISPPSARGLETSVRSEPGGYGDRSTLPRPPPLPSESNWGSGPV